MRTLRPLLANAAVFLVTAAPVCGQNAQSPISIPQPLPVTPLMPTANFDYPVNASLRVTNPGAHHPGAEAGLTMNAGTFTLSDSTNIYTMREFHFHTRSEHTWSGVDYDMEMHILHESGTGQKLVVGRWIRVGGFHTELDRIFGNLGNLPFNLADFNLRDLLPPEDSRGYYQYTGSLTTGTAEPFSEPVEWIMLGDVMEMSQAQVNAFRALVPNGNRRAVQALNDRQVRTNIPAPTTCVALSLAGVFAVRRRRP